MKLFNDIGNGPKQIMTLIDLAFASCQQLYTNSEFIFLVFIRSSYFIEESIKMYNITALFPLSISSVKLQTFCMIGEGKRVKVSIFSLFILSTESSILLKKNHSTNRKEDRLHGLHLNYYHDESCLVKFPGENLSTKDSEYSRVALVVFKAKDAASCSGSHLNLHMHCVFLFVVFCFVLKTVVLKMCTFIINFTARTNL